jgi:hypothetical protein
MKDLKHIKRFNESEENLNISDVSGSKDLVIKVKHLIKYLQDNFDEDAEVTFDHMMKPEYLEDYPVDEIDYLDKLGTFQNYNGDLFIQN